MYKNVDNAIDLMCACIKIAGSLINNDTNIKYRKLINLSFWSTNEESIRNYIQKILEDLEYNVRFGDSYLYLNEKVVKTNNTKYGQEMDNYYKLMVYNPELFSIQPKLLFETFDAIHLGKELDVEQEIIMRMLKNILNEYKDHYPKYIDINIVRNELNFYD